MPDRERAKVLALVLGCIVVGALYALGGIAIYLRRNVLHDTPVPEEHTVITRAPQSAPEDVGTVVGETPTNPPAIATSDSQEPTAPTAPTLYPTMTSAIPEGPSRPAATPTQPNDPTSAQPTLAQPTAVHSFDATATLYPTATPRSEITDEPPAPPTREGR